MQTLVIIDGFSFFFRAFHAVRGNLSKTDGTPTNALYGFAQMLIKVVKDIEPDFCCVALDHPDPTFRHEIYPDYKGTRPEMDEAMKLQMPYFQPMIEAFEIPAIARQGVEADDIIATLATTYGERMNVVIVSSDKDLLQVLGPRENGMVLMHDTMRNKTYDPAAVVEKFGVGPDKVTQVQALIGDSSDNIPGVPSVGPKTAAELIQEFGSLKGVYANLEQVKRDKLREKLAEFKDQAFMSEQLVTLKIDVDLSDVTMEDLSFHPDNSCAAGYLRNVLEFNSLATRLANGQALPPVRGNGPENQEKTANLGAINRVLYRTLLTVKEVEDFIKSVENSKICGMDTETTGLDAQRADLVGISLAVPLKGRVEAVYIPLAHKAKQEDLFGENEPVGNAPWDEIIKLIKDLCANKAVKKVFHNAKYDWHILRSVGISDLENWEDTHLMSFCLSAGKHGHGLDYLAEREFGHVMIPYKAVAGVGQKQVTFDYVELAQATEYAAEDADVTLRLYYEILGWLRDDPLRVYEEIEKPLMFVLADMEKAGVMVDAAELRQLSGILAADIGIYEAEARQIAEKEDLNLSSPKQLGEILYDEWQLPMKGKSRSTDVEVMERLALHEESKIRNFAKAVLGYRQASKLRSTYTEALLEQINPKTGRVHTTYNAGGAATGRFSSSDPNLQNIPIRTEAGRKIRHAFVSKPGYQLLAADYSQIELRLLAHFSKSEALTQAFQAGRDIHAFTASRVFEIEAEQVSKDQRRVAKILNFGLIYGMGARAVAAQLEISSKEAQDYINRFFARYDGVKDYMEANKEFCREHGYVETLKGRRIWLPNITSTNGGFRAGAERAAINAPLQGSNADIIKLAMPQIAAALKDYDAAMLLQVHDELVFEVKADEVAQVGPMIQKVMEEIVTLRVPLKVDWQAAGNWEDAH